MRGTPLLTSHSCVQCKLPVHSVLFCGVEVRPFDGEGESKVSIERLDPAVQQAVVDSSILCKLCFQLTHGNRNDGGEQQQMSAQQDTTLENTGIVNNAGGNQNANTMQSRKTLQTVDLVALFTLEHVQTTITKTNPTDPPKKQRSGTAAPLVDATKCTRLQAFTKTEADGTIISYMPKDLKLDALRKFASQFKVQNVRGMKKAVVCEAIVDKKVQQDTALANGEGEVLAASGERLCLSRKRFINVLSSNRFKGHLHNISATLTAADLTAGLRKGEKSFKEFIKLYNKRNDAEFDLDINPSDHFPDDPANFVDIPSESMWKKCYTLFNTLGSVCCSIYKHVM